jgi:hypothetical protein
VPVPAISPPPHVRVFVIARVPAPPTSPPLSVNVPIVVVSPLDTVNVAPEATVTDAVSPLTLAVVVDPAK